MRRRNFISIVLVALMAGAVVYFAACKKDIVTPIINSEYTPEARQVVGKIKKFKSQLIDKENVARDGLHVPIDSVIWNVEALFNSEYTFPDRKYLETVKHDIQFLVTVNENDEVAFNDVADLYDEITETVRQVYATDGIEQDKSLMAVVVERGDIIGDKAQIDVHVVSGRVETNTMLKNPVGGPFKPGDCWYYGEYGGSCDDPTLLMDAAEIIEDTINYYYSQISVPQGGFRYLNHGMFRISLEGNEYFDEEGRPYQYFFEANGNAPVYLDYEMLNYYYAREFQLLIQILPSDPMILGMMPLNPTFIEVDIVGQLGYVGNSSYYHHKNYVVYGSKALVPEHVLPPVRDLLN